MQIPYDPLKLDNQLCFPLYVCSKEIVKRYKPFLDEIGLTYTQYITMMVLWEEKSINVKSLGKRLYLDSGTLTPLLKKLENQGLLNRERDPKDERNLIVTLTQKGVDLKKAAKGIPDKVRQCVQLSAKDIIKLYRILHKILDGIEENSS
ncbi:MAG: MarR family transcriptional regulator [Oscillospiraceae bacterium]|nr:MarR family transcriptional regulator [Oscillospiraceae bacterium]